MLAHCNLSILRVSIGVWVDHMVASNTADVSNLGYVGRKPTAKRNSDSWFTPDIYLSSVRGVLGEITLDPFSDAQANEIVKAAHYFDEDADGLESELEYYSQLQGLYESALFSRNGKTVHR